ncbi:MAG: hypothetical protein ACLU8F_04950 [Clostridia bacterium]
MGFIPAIFFMLYLVAILATYYSMHNTEKKKRILFLLVGTGVLYAISWVAYTIMFQFSGIKIDNQNALNTIKTSMLLILTPVNVLVLLPFIGRNITKLTEKTIDENSFKKRIFGAILVFIVFLILEMIYTKSTLIYMIETFAK